METRSMKGRPRQGGPKGGQPFPWLACLLLAAACCLSVAAFACYGAHNLDADMSSEMILADLLNEEGRLITDRWYYSTELRIVSPVPVYQMALLLLDDWSAARTLSMALLLVIVEAAFLYWARGAGMGESGLYAAAVLALPFSYPYIYAWLYAGYYSISAALTFAIMGLALRLERERGRLRRLLLLAAFALWGGLNGVRMLMMCAGPLLLAAAYLFFSELRACPDMRSAVRVPSFWMFSGALCAALFMGTGFLINDHVLSAAYDFRNYAQQGIGVFDPQALLNQIPEIAAFFGYRETSSLISLRGVASLAAVALLLFSVCALIVLCRAKLAANQRAAAVLTAASLLLGMLLNMLTGLLSVRYYLPGLMMLVAMLMLAWQHMPCRMRGLRTAGFLALTAAFALEAFVYVREDMYHGTAGYEMTADFLTEQGYTEGYATFWNAATLTEASNGAIEVYTLGDSYWTDDWKQLTLYPFLQKKDHFDEPPQGKVFVLLDWNEAAESDVPYARADHRIGETDMGVIYGYESEAELRALLEPEAEN